MDSDKKVLVKMENEASGGRLQSLKLPRDLTLGLARPKKQYTPNVNAVRTKNKTRDSLKKMDQKRKSTNRRQNKEATPNNNNKQRYLQSFGVFSEGSAEAVKSTASHHPSSGRSDSSSTTSAALLKPTIHKNSSDINAKAESSVLDELMQIDEDNVSEDEEKSEFQPLMLDTTKPAVKSVVKKEESIDNLIPPPFNTRDFDNEHLALCLVKLPDSFAGKGLSDDPNVRKLFDYPLRGMLEGQIGKLIVRKSGKIQAQIGSILYDMHNENTFESKEQLTALVQSENSGETGFAVLGNVMNNYVMYPDYDTILPK